ncbi:hypothetical protein [Comamonas thiooxydans]|uniref:hypothetical protein n=1 Tax=Comamonas thiooxydans TaxID=363952 RepID=UPI000F517001|nr:hypothetical protein [Comamonas thiooxydans]MDO1474025.1 hypothetical protein [Comamonas thiooxydans]
MMNLTRKTLHWPTDKKVIPLSKLPELLADAVTGSPPENPDGESDAWSNYELELGFNLVQYESSINAATDHGELPFRDPRTWERLPTYVNTEHAVVSVKDLQDYLERIGSVIEIVVVPTTAPQPKNEAWGGQAYQPESGLALVDADDAAQVGYALAADELGRVGQHLSSVNTSAPMQGTGDCEDVSRYTSVEEMHLYQQRLVQLADDHFAEQEEFWRAAVGQEVTGISPSAMGYQESGYLPNVQSPNPISAPRPVQRSAAQGAKILAALKHAGHDPQALPNPGPGRPGAKAQAKQALKNDPLFAGTTVFDKAWERLRREGAIADAC